MGDDTWEAISADRPPAILDDDIKKNHRGLLATTKRLKPDDLHDMLPMSFPKTHMLHPTLFPGIAQYPLDDWIEEGRPCITEVGWLKLCLRISQNDMYHLETVFQAATALQSKI